MSRLKAILDSGTMALLVELPGNGYELAQSVEQGGADSLLLQVHNEHPVTGAYTGGLDLEAQQIRDVISILKLPVGLHVGNQKAITREDWEQIVAMNFDYVAMNAARVPPFVLYDSRLCKVLYVSARMPFEYYRVLSGYESAIALSYEAGSQTQTDPNSRFNVLDLVALSLVCKLSYKPVLFRVSQDVAGDDVRGIGEAGCGGLLLDPAFASSTAEHFRNYTSSFRQAIDSFRKKTVFRIHSPWG